MGDEIALTREADVQLDALHGELPDSPTLAELAAQGRTNLASAVLYRALQNSTRHGPFIRAVDNAPAKAVSVRGAPLIVIVPGMFYSELPEIDASATLLSAVAARFDIETVVAPTLSLGSVSDNIVLLDEYLSTLPDREFWFVSLSRGSAEVKWLLRAYPHAGYLNRCLGWVSVCGILSGSPLHRRIHTNRVLRYLHRGFARVNGVSPDLSRELLRDSNDRWQPARLPTHTRLVNLIAVPLSWHVTGSVVGRYRRLCHLGPTDGVVLLGDYLDEPGDIYPVWGVDHFMRTPGLAALFYRLLFHLFASEDATHA